MGLHLLHESWEDHVTDKVGMFELIAARECKVHFKKVTFIRPHELDLCKRPDWRDRHGWVDTKRNFLSCGIIRKTTESFTVLFQQLKFNNAVADKIFELLAIKPTADVWRFPFTRGENDLSDQVHQGTHWKRSSQTAKKVFLIKWQPGISFNQSVKLFHCSFFFYWQWLKAKIVDVENKCI